MGHLGAAALKERIVVSNVIVKPLRVLRQAFVERILNYIVLVVHREMAEQVVFEIVNGIQMNEVYANRMMEVFEVYPETQVTSINNTGNNIFLTSL